MRTFVKVVIFSLIIMNAYSGFANYGIPLLIPEPPPTETVISGNITMPDFIALGSKIFHGKGTCTLCHKEVGHRAPYPLDGTDGVAARAMKRIKDPRYKGKAKTAEEYMRESEIEPSAFVVAGFGKPGTNDSVSPMPATNKGSIGLSDVEINAVIAYFESSAGQEVTVSLPTAEAAATAKGAGEEAAAPSSAKTAQEAITKYGCGTCHMVLKEEGDIGPNLKTVGNRAGGRVKGLSAKAYIRQSILHPNAYVVKDFDADTMPQDFGEKMTANELEMIINFLANSKG